MDGTGNQGIKSEAQSQMEGHPARNGLPRVNRREWIRAAVGGSVGLTLDGLLDVPTVRAATSKLKLANVTEFTTSCNFCSCGCGMIAAVRDGKLIAMEGDYDHIVNRGSLCVKGISMFATHASPNRLKTPLYRAPGSDHWEDIWPRR
jgi:formate dehydrogenase major subunit